MKVAYADPPYPRQSKRHYRGVTDVNGVTWAGEEVDHGALIDRLRSEYPDGWALSTGSRMLREIWALCPEAYCGVWVKPMAANKNQRICLAWEPVLYVARGGVMEDRGSFVRDWVQASPPIFEQKQLGDIPGEKPQHFCYWLFDLLGMGPDDQLDDLFPGSGAVTTHLESWRRQPRIQGLVA